MVKAIGMDFISVPIPGRSLPATGSAASEFIERIAAALETGKNVAVHSRQGIGHSGMIASAVLVSSGLEPNRAMEVGRRSGARDWPFQKQTSSACGLNDCLLDDPRWRPFSPTVSRDAGGTVRSLLVGWRAAESRPVRPRHP